MCEWIRGWEWGDVPTWVASFGALAALFVASYAAGKTRDLLKIESARDEAFRKRDERSQADLVAAWLDKDSSRHPTNIFPWHVNIANASLVPVYELRVVVVYAWTPRVNGTSVFERSLPVVQPGEQRTAIKGLLGRMVTSMSLPEDEANTELNKFNKDNDAVIKACGVWITFRDASGVQWTRSDRGILSRGVNGPFAPGEAEDTRSSSGTS